MTFEECKLLIKPRMGERRYIHSVNVSKEAVKLAKMYGADENKAQFAGILHDVTKETPFDEQLKLIEKSGIILSDIEKNTPKLYHAISGCAYLMVHLDVKDEDILNAVRYHTTARAGMSLLEKVIFLADFTSEERNYPDVDIMREKTYTNLDDGLLYGVTYTIKTLVEKGAVVHPDAVNAYNEIILKNMGK